MERYPRTIQQKVGLHKTPSQHVIVSASPHRKPGSTAFYECICGGRGVTMFSTLRLRCCSHLCPHLDNHCSLLSNPHYSLVPESPDSNAAPDLSTTPSPYTAVTYLLQARDIIPTPLCLHALVHACLFAAEHPIGLLRAHVAPRSGIVWRIPQSTGSLGTAAEERRRGKTMPKPAGHITEVEATNRRSRNH